MSPQRGMSRASCFGFLSCPPSPVTHRPLPSGGTCRTTPTWPKLKFHRLEVMYVSPTPGMWALSAAVHALFGIGLSGGAYPALNDHLDSFVHRPAMTAGFTVVHDVSAPEGSKLY